MPDLSRRALGLGALGTLASACDARSAPSNARAQIARPAPLNFRRGIGVHHMLNWAEYEDGPGYNYLWPPFQREDYQTSAAEIENLRRVGFDFVRLTVAPDIFMASSGQRSADLAAILVDRVTRLRDGGLSVIVDLHPTSRNPAYTGERIWSGAGSLVFQRYIEIVGELATALSSFADRVALELMNEPQAYGLGAAHRWHGMAARLISAARARAPKLPLVITNHDSGLAGSLPHADDNLIYTFHHYSPLLFTHQTVIDSARYLSNLPWPASRGVLADEIAAATRRIEADRTLARADRGAAIAQTENVLRRYFERDYGPDQIAADFAAIARWADSNGIARGAVLLGEFGVVRTHRHYRGAAEEDRLRWLETVRIEAERCGFAWAVWVYRGEGGMALADEDDVLTLDAPSLRALGLSA